MKVSLNANRSDQATGKIADVLLTPFRSVSAALSKEYGGTMEHLWIDFELNQFHCEMRPPFPFRFQKKVGGGKCKLTGLQNPIYENVGHYSVRPDFGKLIGLPLEDIGSYALSLIHESTTILVEKRKKLGGFDADSFRADFGALCEECRRGS